MIGIKTKYNMKLVNESLKDEFIARLMSTVFKDDDPKYKNKTIEYLESLDEDTLDEMLSDYETFGITYHQ
jgi:predicted exporter